MVFFPKTDGLPTDKQLLSKSFRKPFPEEDIYKIQLQNSQRKMKTATVKVTVFIFVNWHLYDYTTDSLLITNQIQRNAVFH